MAWGYTLSFLLPPQGGYAAKSIYAVQLRGAALGWADHPPIMDDGQVFSSVCQSGSRPVSAAGCSR
nr:MAG TPA: hypothetical protein [Caudoviricetes sp.]